ncbi:uncharacterized protein TNCV_1709761 [Trichonephila clavipes]|nr:uncharacterized protein TNCV_1709761 [Trichonephila clavipes]
MDGILTTARDLEFERNDYGIEELIMGHENELTKEELQEILNEEHQETQRNVSPSEQEEDERCPMPTSTIKDILKKWEAARGMVLEWHPNQADVSRAALPVLWLVMPAAVPLGMGSNPGKDGCLKMCIAFEAWRYSKYPPSRKSSSEVGERHLTIPWCSPSKFGWNRAKSQCNLHGAQSYG